jgi:hypothetical protein
MATKKPFADKPDIKVEMTLADPADDQDDGNTVIQITISCAFLAFRLERVTPDCSNHAGLWS